MFGIKDFFRRDYTNTVAYLYYSGYRNARRPCQLPRQVTTGGLYYHSDVALGKENHHHCIQAIIITVITTSLQCVGINVHFTFVLYFVCTEDSFARMDKRICENLRGCRSKVMGKRNRGNK